MLGLLLGGLVGRAAMGRAAMARPMMRRASPLGGLMRRSGGGGGPRSDIGGGGQSAIGASQDPVTTTQEAEQPPRPEQPQEIAQPSPQPFVSQAAEGIQQQQDKAQQAAQQAPQPVRPLEGLLDEKPQAAAPQTAPGTRVPEPPLAINQGEGVQTTVAQQGQRFPAAPTTEQSFIGERIRQLPPRSTFEAPEANPSKPISTDTQVSNASPGYSTIGMSLPQYQFSYLRR